MECDYSGVPSDGGWRPEFADVTTVSGFLDKELEASGFTRKDREDIEKVQVYMYSHLFKILGFARK